jgi:hypothetical protein
MKNVNEATLLSTGNATSLMVFIDIAYSIQNQRSMLSIAFPSLGNKGIYKMLRGFANVPSYTENKDQLTGMAERFFNDGPLKALYKTLAFLTSKETGSEEADRRMQDVNRVLSKIERMIKSKLTSEEQELFTSLEDSIDNYSDSLNSNLNSSLESSVKAEEEPVEEPKEEPKPEEKPKEEPKVEPKEQPTEEPKEEPTEEPTEKQDTSKSATTEHFTRIIKKLVREELKKQLRKK